MSKVNRFGVVAVAAALSLGSAVGWAQTFAPTQSDQSEAGPGFGPMMGGWGRGPMGMMGDGMGRWMMGAGVFAPQVCSMMARHVDGRLANLKAELKITDAQESLRKDYAAVLRDRAKGMLAHCTAATMGSREGAGLSLTDRTDWHERFVSAQLDAVRATNKALKPLYAAFSDEQKAADQMFWGRWA
jgi:hypothetical protein